MSERTFDRETLLDLTVNVIPLGIILFFVVVFLIIRPWGPNLYMEVVSMGLLVIPFVALAALTYFSGRVIARDEAGGAGTTTGGTLSTTDATLDGSQANADDANADDYSMVEDRLDAEPDTPDESQSRTSNETERATEPDSAPEPQQESESETGSATTDTDESSG